MIRSILVVCCCLLAAVGWSQSNDLIFKGTKALSSAEKATMPAIDNDQLMAEESALRAPGRAPRFAELIAVDINTKNSGIWEEIGDKSIWRLQIASKDAKSINLGLTQFFMPDGGTFIIYDPKGSNVLGPFTPSDNEVHNQLWTPIFEGDQIVLEVVVPTAAKAELQFHLSSVNHDFMGFGNALLSGSCNLDVNCSDADGWGIVDGYRDIIRSVAVIGTGGGTFCTGFLINNVNNDAKPFFMTAAHCGIDFSSSPTLVAYWNFENSTCREPNSGASGAGGDGQLNVFNTGSVYAAGYGPSDFVLVEFDDPIHPDAGAFMAGFTIDPNPPTDTTICVHHPSTDEKRISFEFDDTHIGVWPGDGVVAGGDHIIVPDWDIGTTEGGSSGSPLFDKNKRVVGQLHGGGAACGNDLYDSYGWFYSSWVGGGTPGTRLSDFLDPDGTGITTIDGLDLDFSITLDQNSATFCAPEDQSFELAISDKFETDVSLTIMPAPPAGVNFAFSNENPAPGTSVTVSFTNTGDFDPGSYSYTITATDGTNSTTTGLTLNVSQGIPNLAALSQPENEFEGASTNLIYVWEELPNTELYDLQVATDPAFTDVLITVTDIEGTSSQGMTLEILSTYYWRVRGINICGTGDWSAPYSFSTAAILCNSEAYSGDPVDVPTVIATVEATQNITIEGIIVEVKVLDLDIEHSYVGDLIVTLISPAGTEVILVDRMGVPNSGYGCSSANLLVGFDDFASATAEDLEESCEGDAYAAEGIFQPVEALSTLGGEPAMGEWKIRVDDAADQDGGQILDFTLEICSTLPNNTDISPERDVEISCFEANSTFSIFVGTAYTADVNLSAEGFPSGTTVSFDPNPAAPGSNVMVTVDNGTAAAGSYDVEFIGNDGTDSGAGTMAYNIEDAPGAFGLMAPANAALDVAMLTDFAWNESTFAQEYQITGWPTADPGNLVVDEMVQSTSWQQTLMGATDYTWQVKAIGACGEVLSNEMYSFRTIGNLAFGLNTNNLTGCLFGTESVTLSVGDGYFAPASLSYSITPTSDDIEISYNVDPADVQPGTDVNVTITIPVATMIDDYDILFSISDGTHDSQTLLNLEIESTPTSFTLIMPTDDLDGVNLLPSFDWTSSNFADNYVLEVSTDSDFTTLEASANSNVTNYTLLTMLAAETMYFWRVTANGDCGSSVSAVFSFTTETSGVTALGDLAITVAPNPVTDWVNISLNQSNSAPIKLSVIEMDGRVLTNETIAIGQLTTAIDMSNYPLGVYLLEVETGGVRYTEKLVKL